MFGLRPSHSPVSKSQSWFALKKEEFYVILDTVLTEMTSQQRPEERRRDVTGCMELIKLLNDNNNDADNNREVGTKNAQNGSKDRQPETAKQRAEVVGGRRFRSRGSEATSGRKDDRAKSGFDRRSRSGDENSQLSDVRRTYCTKFSEDQCNERRPCLRRSNNGGSQNLEPNRMSATPGRTDLNTRTSCKGSSSSSSSCLYLKRPLTDVPDVRRSCDQSRDRRHHHHHHNHHHPTDVSKSVSGQSLDFGRTRKRGAVSAPSTCRTLETAPKRKLRSQNRADDSDNKISDEISNPERGSENYVWTAIDKSVINGIVDSLLLDPTGVKKKSRVVTRDADVTDVIGDACSKRVKISDDVVVKPCDALSVLGSKSRVKTEDVKSDDVTDDVKLDDVTRFDVTEMGFKWKSKLLWRMNRDDAYPSKLCMT